MERFARDFEDEFRARGELGDDGKIAVIARARLGGEAESNLGLNDDVDFVDEISEGEEVMKNGRRNVVRKIAVDAQAAAGSDGGETRMASAISSRQWRSVRKCWPRRWRAMGATV